MQVNDVLDYVCDRLRNAVVKHEPYPHIYVTDVFPPDFYEMMLVHLPDDASYTDHSYDNRGMVDVVDYDQRPNRRALDEPFWSRYFMGQQKLVMPFVRMFGLVGRLSANLRLVRDSKGYVIKPHTDVKAKAMSALFYLPVNNDYPQAGTTIYTPKERGFQSAGNQRYEFDLFDPYWTAPYVRNAMLAFPRSDISFHGVAPSEVPSRDVLLLNVYRFQ